MFNLRGKLVPHMLKCHILLLNFVTLLGYIQMSTSSIGGTQNILFAHVHLAFCCELPQIYVSLELTDLPGLYGPLSS